MDFGSQFKYVVAKEFKRRGIFVKVGKAGRPRQQAIIERMNSYIGRIIAMRQLSELATKETSVEWVEDRKLPLAVIKYLQCPGRHARLEKIEVPGDSGAPVEMTRSLEAKGSGGLPSWPRDHQWTTLAAWATLFSRTTAVMSNYPSTWKISFTVSTNRLKLDGSSIDHLSLCVPPRGRCACHWVVPGSVHRCWV